jgi:quinol monooxygenase YgiN
MDDAGCVRGAPIRRPVLLTRSAERSVLIVHVHVHVKPDAVDAFAAATYENASQSVREPGVVRFDVVRQDDDPTRFLLIEIYRTGEDPGRHKQTPHYAEWRDAVESMMAEPRRSVRYHALFPEPPLWELAGEIPG